MSASTYRPPVKVTLIRCTFFRDTCLRMFWLVPSIQQSKNTMISSGYQASKPKCILYSPHILRHLPHHHVG